MSERKQNNHCVSQRVRAPFRVAVRWLSTLPVAHAHALHCGTWMTFKMRFLSYGVAAVQILPAFGVPLFVNCRPWCAQVICVITCAKICIFVPSVNNVVPITCGVKYEVILWWLKMKSARRITAAAMLRIRSLFLALCLRVCVCESLSRTTNQAWPWIIRHIVINA